MSKGKDKDVQIKFTVNEKQKQRLDVLAKQREISVPQFAKLTALGVRMTPAPVVGISEGSSEEKELLEEILEHFEVTDAGKEVIFISSQFNGELISKIKKYLKK